jgi:glycosyltransferase involved in cell wall biosynthesis
LSLFLTLTRRTNKSLVTVDLVLTQPQAIVARLRCWLVKQLLRRVDHFINYFKYSEGYASYYGVTPDRSSFVHFKPHLGFRCETGFHPDGDYVLCCGRSRRDYDTFFRAIERLPYPAAIPTPDFAQLRQHGSQFSYRLDQLPSHLTLLPDDGSHEAIVRIVRGAKIVAVPLVSSNLLGGNSIYLNAMLTGKCVIVSEGAGVSDVLTDEAIIIPGGDDQILASTIKAAWEDDQLRINTARRGYEHALSLGGEPELYQRILEVLVARLTEPRM